MLVGFEYFLLEIGMILWCVGKSIMWRYLCLYCLFVG